MKTFQYQLSNGNWADIDNSRKIEFLDDIVKYDDHVNSHADAMEMMERGEKLRHFPDDWYSNCRLFDKEQYEKDSLVWEKAEEDKINSQIICKSCGQTGQAGGYPFSTLGGENICDDCI